MPEPALIRVEAGSRFPVSAREGFDYIPTRAWLDHRARAISVEPGARWERPDDRARVELRLGGLRVALDMTLVRIDPYRLVEYTSRQTGLLAPCRTRSPAAPSAPGGRWRQRTGGRSA